MFSIRLLPLLGVALLLSGGPAFANDALDAPMTDDGWDEELDVSDLRDLLDIEVTSVAGAAESVLETPAAIHIITAEDIRRAGHRTIPDALRSVPGVNVAQLSATTWAISARGFNSRFSNKLLVLVDGRAIYTDLFAGTFWDEITIPVEEVERIEVIRGPGATIWGANAVNGVINIVTRRAKDSEGAYAVAGAGDVDRGYAAAGYGTSIGSDLYLKVFTRFLDRASHDFENGGNAGDSWHNISTGFRLEYEGLTDKIVTLQGDFLGGSAGETVLTPMLTPPFATAVRSDTATEGGHVLARVEELDTSGSGWSLQAYYDRNRRRVESVLSVVRETVDVEFRQNFRHADRHTFAWGFGFRHRADDTRGTNRLSFRPNDRRTNKVSAFAQENYSLVPDTLQVMVGSKFEYNEYSGFEVQPGARLSWTPDDRQTVWASVARAVRTPDRATEDVTLLQAVIPPPLAPVPTPVLFIGDGSVRSEKLVAYELGYRVAPSSELTFDFATFFNDYADLITAAATLPPSPNLLSINDASGKAYGFEASTSWRPSRPLFLGATYSFFKLNLSGVNEGAERETPKNQLTLRTHFDVTEKLELNGAFYYVDNVSGHDIPSYGRLDLGLVWRPADGIEVGLWGQNLADGDHTEFLDPLLMGSAVEIPRSFFGQISIRF